MAFHLLSSFPSAIIVMEAGVSQAADKEKYNGGVPPHHPPHFLGDCMTVLSVHPGVIVK